MLKYISSFTFHFDFEFIRILFLKIKTLSDIYNQRHHPETTWCYTHTVDCCVLLELESDKLSVTVSYSV